MPEPVVHVKKRRTFFSSALSFLPQIPSLKPTYTPSEQVLAALHAPGEDAKRADRPKREVRKGEPSGMSIDKDGESSHSGDAGVDASVEDASKEGAKASGAFSFAIGNTIIGPHDGSTPPVPPVAARRTRAPVVPPPSPPPARRRAPRPTPIDASTANQAITSQNSKASTSRPRGKLADSAQSTNEKLSAAMMIAMRASIAGNKKPYERTVTHWTVTPSKTAIAPAAHMPLVSKRVRVVKIKRTRGKPKSRMQPIKVIKIREGLARLAKKPKVVVVEEDDDSEDIENDAEVSDRDESRIQPARKGKGKEKEVERRSIAQSGRGGKGKEKASEITATGPSRKKYLAAGFYCQDANARSPHKLVSKVLHRRETEAQLRKKGKAASTLPIRSKRLSTAQASSSKPDSIESFPPLPYDYGHEYFFGQEHDFVLPYNITWEAENGVLDGKKKPGSFQKLRSNVFPERHKRTTDMRAMCHCDPESRCGDNCINRMMNYLCGKDCPSGEACDNKSLTKRIPALTKVFYTGSRGFGLMAMEDIAEGRFVIDYRGEVISLDSFVDRISNEYKGQRNFYALDYDGDEVIDSGMRGNEARFINHGCNPNLQVHKLQAMGDGSEEYEVGMWALRDINKGEELFYDYNFDTFGSSDSNLRTKCACGAPNCIGFLGRKSGERSAKEIAIEQAAQAAADAQRTEARVKRGKLIPFKSKSIKRSLTIKIGTSAARGPHAVSGRKRKAGEAVRNSVTRVPLPMFEAEIPPVIFDSAPSKEISPPAVLKYTSSRRIVISRKRASGAGAGSVAAVPQLTVATSGHVNSITPVIEIPTLNTATMAKKRKYTKVLKRPAPARDVPVPSAVLRAAKMAIAEGDADLPPKAKKKKSTAGSTTIRLPARALRTTSGGLPIVPSLPLKVPLDILPVADKSPLLDQPPAMDNHADSSSVEMLTYTVASTVAQTPGPLVAAPTPSTTDDTQTAPPAILPLSAWTSTATPATTMIRTPSFPSGTPDTPEKCPVPPDITSAAYTLLKVSEIGSFQIDPSLRDLPAPPKMRPISSVAPTTPIAASRPLHSTARPAPDTTDTNTPSSGSTASGADQPKRKSGWANWLKKQAGGGSRSLEEWHELRMKRRRGVGWMNMMIQEYGIADSPVTLGAGAYANGAKPAGSMGSFANTIAALGKGPLAEPAKRLGGPSLKGAHKASEKTAQGRVFPASAISPDEEVPSDLSFKTVLHIEAKNVMKRSSAEYEAEAESSISKRARSSLSASETDLYISTRAYEASTTPAVQLSTGTSTFWVHDEPARTIPMPAYTLLPPQSVAASGATLPFSMEIGGASRTVTMQGASHVAIARPALARSAIARPACSPPPPRIPSTASTTSVPAPAAHGDRDYALPGRDDVNRSITPSRFAAPTPIAHTPRAIDLATLKFEHNTVPAFADSTTLSTVLSTTTVPHTNPTPLPAHAPLGGDDASAEGKKTNKKKAIAARNGAPMGWAFVPVRNDGNRSSVPGAQVHEDLPRSARRGRASLLRQDIIDAEMGRV